MTHIQQGIYLPLKIRHDLVNNVTSRSRGLRACSHYEYVHKYLLKKHIPGTLAMGCE